MNLQSKGYAWVAGAAMAVGAMGSAQALDLYLGGNYLLVEAAADRYADTPGREDRPDSVRRVVRTNSEGGALMAHVGIWLSESFAFEVRAGFPGEEAEYDTSGQNDHVVEIENYIGAYIVPRAQPWSWVDLMFPVGAAQVKALTPVDNGDGTTGIVQSDAAEFSYGIDMRLNFGQLIADPDTLIGSLSLNAGFMVLGTDADVDFRSYNGGLQFGLNF